MVVATPFTLNDKITRQGEYPLDVVMSKSSNKFVAAPMSMGDVEIYNSTNLKPVIRLKQDSNSIISQCMFDTDPNLIWVCNKNSTINVFDMRNAEIVARFQPSTPALTFDLNCSRNVLAVGTELTGDSSSILFWDIRNPSQIAYNFEDCHSDDITQVKFHPMDPNAMISGSTDGLCCLYNLTTMDEEESLYQVIKDNSVSKLGYFGPSWEYIYILTHMETFSIHTFTDSEKLANYGDVRAVTPDFKLDYCIDCRYDSISNNLFVTAGSQEGTLGILNVSLDGLNLVYTLNQGHEDIVRGASWIIEDGIIISGAEDGTLCLWRQSVSTS